MFPEAQPVAQHRRSLMTAALATSAITPLIYVLYLAAFALLTGGNAADDFSKVMGSAAFVMYLGVPVSLFSMFVIGWPLLALLHKSRWLVWPLVCLIATLAGLAGMIALGVVFSELLDGETLAFGAIMGAAAGAVFSLIAGIGYRRC